MALCATTITYSLVGDFSDNEFGKNDDEYQKPLESYFKYADYYLFSRTRQNFHLFANELIHNQTSKELILTGPNGVIITKKQEPIYYTAESGFFNLEQRKLYLKESVTIRAPRLTINAQELNYDDVAKVLNASGEVFTKTENYNSMYEVIINAHALNYAHEKEILTFTKDVKGQVVRTRKYELPIFFNAQKMQFEMVPKYLKLQEEVSFKKQDLDASARNGELFFENYNKKLKYFTLSDDVIVKEKVTVSSGETFERSAFSEKLEGHIADSKLILLGSPKVYQKKDVLKGNMIILRENNETIEVDDANTNFRLR